MAATVNNPASSASPELPVFRIVRTFCLDNIDKDFFNKSKTLSEKFFCHKDPHRPLFYLSLWYGKKESRPNDFSAYVIAESREVTVKSFKIIAYDADGVQIGTSKWSQLDMSEEDGLGVSELCKYQGPSPASSPPTSWRLLLDFEYYGVAPVVAVSVTPPRLQLQKDFLQLLKVCDQADIVFLVRGVKIPAHKVVLTTRCDYFRRMFDSGMAESVSKEIEVPDIEPHVFTELLSFIYSDVPPKYNADSTMALLSASHKYGVDNLTKICERNICANLNSLNVIEALLLAEKHDCQALMERATAVFGSYVSILKSQKKWKKLLESPLLLLQLLEHSYD